MIQVIGSFSPEVTATATALYNCPLSMRRWTGSIDRGNVPVAAAGTFRNLRVHLGGSPGGSANWSYDLMVNGVASSLGVNVAAPNVEDTDTSNDVHVDVGDLICLRRLGTSTPAASSTQVSIEFESDNPGESIYGGHDVAGGSIGHHHAFFPDDDMLSSPEFRSIALVPIAGSVRHYRIEGETAMSGTVLLVKNSIDQDGSGGTVDTRITFGGGTSGNWSGLLTFVPGDTLRVSYAFAASERVKTGLCFTSDVDGYFIIGGVDGTTLDVSATEYNNPVAGDVSDGWTGTEDDHECIGGVTPVLVRGMYGALDQAPGSGGDSFTLNLRKNNAAAGPTITFLDAATTASDLVNSTIIASGDTWSIECVPGGSPTARSASWTWPGIAVAAVEGLEIRLTQYVLTVGYNEFADATVDPPAGEQGSPPAVVACVGGGTVPTGTNPTPGTSLATTTAPLAWVEITVGATVYRYAASDIPHGLPKTGRVESFGEITRTFSDADKGYEAARVLTVLSDTDRVLRGLANSGTLRNALVEYYIADHATIVAAGTPERQFRGLLVDWDPEPNLAFSITVLDILTARLTSTNAADKQTPITNTNNIADQNPEERMRDKALPEAYGFISDGLDEDPVWECKYVASITVAGHEELGNMHAFLVCVGAISRIQRIWGASEFEDPPVSRLPIPSSALGDWLWVPTMDNYFQADDWYESNGRRYTIIFGQDGHPVVELARKGRIPFIIDFCAYEHVGDTSGLVINSPPRALQHWLENRLLRDSVANWATTAASYGDYSILETTSFAAVHTMCAALGYELAGIVGADFGFKSWRDRVSEFLRAMGAKIGANANGQIILGKLDVTDAAASATAFDPDTILEDTLRVQTREDEVENVIHYLYGEYHKRTLPDLTPIEGERLYRDPYDGRWFSGLQSVTNATSVTALGGDPDGIRDSEQQEYNLVRDPDTADALAAERLDLKSPPNGRYLVTFEIMLHQAAGIELGDIITVEHWDCPWTGARRCEVQQIVTKLDGMTKVLTCEDVEDLLP